MAIDQRDITSQLRMMDDRALQQYAAMHKSDPYVFPLAFQESQNRQKVRMSGQAQMAGQEQPKVNDAALMAMAPQAQGISGLAAPNIQHMADGGIAGYDEEQGMATGGMGGMFNFAQQSEPVVRMSGGGVPGYRGPTDGEDPEQVTDEFAGVDDQIAANLERQKMMGAFDDYSKPIPKPKASKKDSKADKKEEEPKKAELPALATYTPKTAEEIKTASNTMAKPELEEIQKGYKPFAEQFAQDRSRIEGREKNAVSDALIRAGLATMAGKSQFAMQNIGEGGLQGLNAYQEGQKANEASRRALTQSEMLMTQAQRAEERGARSEAMSLYAQAEKSQQAGVQLGQEARKIENTDAYQKGSLANQNISAKASMLAAQAAMSRANALNTTAGTKGQFTEAQVAAARDKAADNITNDKAYLYNQMLAAKAAKDAGKPFDPAAYKKALIDAETERLLAGTSKATIPTATPTGGKLGGGTFDPTRWGNVEVVTPK